MGDERAPDAMMVVEPLGAMLTSVMTFDPEVHVANLCDYQLYSTQLS